MAGTSDLGERLAKLVPLLSSDQPGEVVATARAIGRVLKAERLDWHDVVGAIRAGLQVILRGLATATDRARAKIAEAQLLLDRALAAEADQPPQVRGKPNPALDRSKAEQETEIAKQTWFLERNNKAAEVLNDRLSTLQHLRRRADDWRYSLDPTAAVTVFAGEIKLPQNTDLVDLRKKIARATADSRAVQDAPRSLDELDALVDREIERLRQAGAPSFGRIIDGASDQIRWPQAEQLVHSIGTAKGGGSVNSVGRFGSIDSPALLAWLWPEAFADALHEEIRAQLGDGGIGAEERAKRLKALRKELLGLERQEEAIVDREQPEASRRRDADLRAFLGLSDEVPVPGIDD